MTSRFLIFLACWTLPALAGDSPKTIVELQEFRSTDSIPIRSKDGKQGRATLINLNPAINAWYLLEVAWTGASEVAYHLENPKPGAQRLLLDETYPAGLVILNGKNRYPCDLVEGDTLVQARGSRLIFQPLCEGRIYLRNPATGHRTTLEAAVELLREHVWGGEKIISLGHILLGDLYRESATIQQQSMAGAVAKDGNGPAPALIDPEYCNRLLMSNNLGIDLGGAEKTGLIPGAWYPVSATSGVYASIIQPNLIDPSVLQGHKKLVNNLDTSEASALAYLVAFDLDRFDLGYALGTEHPKVGWSDHMLPSMRDPALLGPDGIANIAPLVSTGLISPEAAPKTIASFTAGFKREHGAFKYGELALKNYGSHYGFLEQGVVFSRLQPGLSTISVLDDGSVVMKTWTEEDNKSLKRIKYARQNGVPLIEAGIPGDLVTRWGPGNWSGSEDMKLRTMRSGFALQKINSKRFLIYAVFSTATPSAMARVFEAYRCDYAMLLDMNALEHTYMALYRRAGSRVFVDHLVKGMSELDKSASGEVLPRFLGYADNRDFFYVMRKEATR